MKNIGRQFPRIFNAHARSRALGHRWARFFSDYYNTLGIERAATEAEIRKSYLKLAKQHHPDLVQGEEEKKKATETFREILEAYKCLSDSKERNKYDQFLKSGTTSSSSSSSSYGPQEEYRRQKQKRHMDETMTEEEFQEEMERLREQWQKEKEEFEREMGVHGTFRERGMRAAPKEGWGSVFQQFLLGCLGLYVVMQILDGLGAGKKEREKRRQDQKWQKTVVEPYAKIKSQERAERKQQRINEDGPRFGNPSMIPKQKVKRYHKVLEEQKEEEEVSKIF